MIQIRTEQNIEVLRQVALLQEVENNRLYKRLRELLAQLAELRDTDQQAELELELRRLQEELFKDGWSGDIISDHNRLLKSIGCTEVSRSGNKTRELIESGVITEVPGYDVDVSWYDNRLEDD